MPADLHLHTPTSDGTDDILDRVAQASDYGLEKIAITDHDSINEKLEGRTREIEGVEVITGAEIKCEIDGEGIEILGYFLEPSDSELYDLFEKMSNNRVNRMEDMIERVNDGEEINLSFEDVNQYSEGTIGRPHLAQTLIDKSVAEDMDDAFSKYIGEDAPTNYYVETEKLDAGKVIDAVRENGGATSLAHPGRDLKSGEADEKVKSLVSEGLDAIEVPYTYQHKRQEGYGINFGIQRAYDLAKENDLVISGGSDCHGEQSDKYNIGKIRLENDNVETLRQIARSRQ
jgi:predicted metal-dependent phosphoesterase TrpH